MRLAGELLKLKGTNHLSSVFVPEQGFDTAFNLRSSHTALRHNTYLYIKGGNVIVCPET